MNGLRGSIIHEFLEKTIAFGKICYFVSVKTQTSHRFIKGKMLRNVQQPRQISENVIV